MRKILMQGLLWLWLCLFHINTVFSVIPPGYLDFDNLPDTNFSCVGKVIGGYYADLETSCQMFHVCTIGQLDEPMDIRFLCLNGTVFDQETRVCERVDEVDCSKSEKFYSLNLELYGNTAPPIVEEPERTEAPKKLTTTTTTTQKTTTGTVPTRPNFYTTPQPTVTTPTHGTPKVITSHQFPVNGGPDIRFNPEEINIKLTPGSPPIIKSQTVTYQKFDSSDARITTHPSIFTEERPHVLAGSQLNRPSVSVNTQKPKSVVSYGLQHTPTQNYHYDYNYQHTETSELDYRTDLPSKDFIYNTKLGEFGLSNIAKDYQSTQHIFTATATKTPTQSESTQYSSSTAYPSSLKPPQIYQFQRTDKPPLQLPIPLLPTLPPLTFSSPAPFTLSRHFETKRSNDHQLPRVVVSASASVSDASGRKVNYSLGTIGASLLGKAPNSYDEYKEDDVGLDPFYHDVPKVNRRKRQVQEDIETTTKLDETTTENLSQTTHWLPPDYVDDNYEGQTYDEPIKTNEDTTKKNKTTKKAFDYIDDNYEPINYKTPEVYQDQPETTTQITTTNEPTEGIVTTSDASTTTTDAILTTDINESTTNDESTTLDSSTTVQPTTESTEDGSSTVTEETTTQYQSTTPEGQYMTSTYSPPESTVRSVLSTNGYTEQSDGTENAYETTTAITSTKRYNYGRRGNKRFGTKPTRSRHRFSSPTIHLSQSVLKLQGSKHMPFSGSTEAPVPKKSPIYYKNKLSKLVPTVTVELTTSAYDEMPPTDAALSKSVNPTEAKVTQSSVPTTPLSKASQPRRFHYGAKHGFTCIGKETRRFYEDPRDCRLFHYCTPGYTHTQVLDMKFVCDFGTYFDLDKLICTRNKPLTCK